MIDETRNLVEKWQQQQITEYLLQKMKLIQGDLKMNRNHKENLVWLINFNGELNKRIAKEVMLGNKITGFVELRDEVAEWIKIVSEIVYPNGI